MTVWLLEGEHSALHKLGEMSIRVLYSWNSKLDEGSTPLLEGGKRERLFTQRCQERERKSEGGKLYLSSLVQQYF